MYGKYKCCWISNNFLKNRNPSIIDTSISGCSNNERIYCGFIYCGNTNDSVGSWKWKRYVIKEWYKRLKNNLEVFTQLALFRNLNTISKCWYRSNWKCTLQYNSGSFATITYYNTNFEPENRKRWVGGRSQFSTNLHQSKETSLWVSCYKSSRNKSDLNCRKKKVDKDINDIQCFDLLHNENKCFLQKTRNVWIIDNLWGL